MGATRSFLISECLLPKMSPHFRSDHDAVTMAPLIIVLAAFAVYPSEVYCDTLPIKIAKSGGTVPLERNNNSHAMIEKESFRRNVNLSRHKLEESGKPNGANSEADKRKGRFLNSLAFLTGLSFGGLTNAAATTTGKNAAKMPQAMLSINLGSSRTSPYFAAYYSQYPASSLLPYPFLYPFGLAPTIDAAKLQTTQQNELTPQLISLIANRPLDLAGNNEDYTDKFNGAGNGADDRIKLRAQADRNAEEKGAIHACKEAQRKYDKETAREREYLHVNAADLPAALSFRDANQTVRANKTNQIPPHDTNTTHHYHHHHHHHHGGGHEEQHPGYYGGYPQNVHHVDLTTTSPYSQVSYSNIPYEQPANFYYDDKNNLYSRVNPSFTAPFSPETNVYAATDFNRLYQPPNISDTFKPLI